LVIAVFSIVTAADENSPGRNSGLQRALDELSGTKKRSEPPELEYYGGPLFFRSLACC
jgi:hypothetical protein